MRTAAFETAVEAAIDRGVAHLLAAQDPEGGFGTYPGYPAAQTALVIHTLRVCGVPADDPSIDRAYASLRREIRAARRERAMRTYTAGLCLMALADRTRGAAPDRAPRRGTPRRPPPDAAADLPIAADLVAWLGACQSLTGAWRYGSDQPYGARGTGQDDHDHSNTQYAILGLRAAAQCGAEVPTETWQRALDHLLGAQEATGPEVRDAAPRGPGATSAPVVARARGWMYTSAADPARLPRGAAPTIAMTATGVASVIIARDALAARSLLPHRTAAAADRSIRDGLAWLASRFDVSNRVPHHLYAMYALERAADLAATDWIGGRDWYGEGAAVLLDEQAADGSWRDPAGTHAETCFALLFLRRAERTGPRPTLTPATADAPLRFEGARDLSGDALSEFVGTVVARWRRAADDAARTELVRGLAGVGERVLLPLVARMDAPDPTVRAAAHRIAAGVVGRDLRFDPDAAPAARRAALDDFEAWWMARAGRLVFDPARGHLVAR